MVRIVTQELNPSTKFGGKLDPENNTSNFPMPSLLYILNYQAD